MAGAKQNTLVGAPSSILRCATAPNSFISEVSYLECIITVESGTNDGSTACISKFVTCRLVYNTRLSHGLIYTCCQTVVELVLFDGPIIALWNDNGVADVCLFTIALRENKQRQFRLERDHRIRRLGFVCLVFTFSRLDSGSELSLSSNLVEARRRR